VSQSRSERNPNQGVSTPVLAEALRAGSEAGKAAAPAGDEGKISIFWRVFGGTLLSIAALVLVTVYQQFTSGINDLRNEAGHINADLRKDLGRLSEAQGDLVKKEDLNGRARAMWDAIKEVQADRSTLTTLKERCTVLMDLFKAGEEERRQLVGELQKLREQKAAADERRELVREVQALREKLAQLEGRQAAPAVTPAAPAAVTPAVGTPAIHKEEENEE
jgi:chromosome segregation ATPase